MTIWKKLLAAIFPKPRTAVIDICSSCNAFCSFCPRQNIEKPPAGFMEQETFRAILGQLSEFPELSTIRLYAYGEPLLHPNFSEFIVMLSRFPWEKRLSTNLSLANRYFQDLMTIDVLQYSIEGWDKASFENFRRGLEFETILSNVQILDKMITDKRKRGEKTPERWLRFLVTRQTKIDLFMKTWLPMVDKIFVEPIFPALRWQDPGKKFIQIFSEKLGNQYLPFRPKKGLRGCREIFETITINAKGDVMLCCADFSAKIKLGTYNNLREAFYNRKRLKIWFQFYLQTFNICLHCPSFLEGAWKSVEEVIPGLEKYRNHPKIQICL